MAKRRSQAASCFYNKNIIPPFPPPNQSSTVTMAVGTEARVEGLREFTGKLKVEVWRAHEACRAGFPRGGASRAEEVSPGHVEQVSRYVMGPL